MSARHSCAAFCSCSSFGSGVPEDDDDDVILRLRLGDDADWLVPPNMWKSDGAKQTARLLAFIWLRWECEAISLRKRRSDCSTSRFSSGSNMHAHCTASRRSSGGTSANQARRDVTTHNHVHTCTRTVHVHVKMLMKVSESLLVSKHSGSSRKYCLIKSATSYGCRLSKSTVSENVNKSSLILILEQKTTGNIK